MRLDFPQPEPTDKRPTANQLAQELMRLERREQAKKSIWSAASVILVITAVAVLIITLWIPVFQVQRTSMNPTLVDGEVVAFIRTGQIRRGDVIAFYHGNHILIKRVIAIGGDWVDMTEDGRVILNFMPLEEEYVSELSAGEPGLTFPFQVTDRQYFVLGDQRTASLDSRDENIGPISQDQIIGRFLVRVWPLNRFGAIK